jgi:hypothetical protein
MDPRRSLFTWKKMLKRIIKKLYCNGCELSDAQCGIGVMYWNGNCVKKDIKEDVKWLLLSSNNGNEDAADILDEMEDVKFTLDDYIQDQMVILRLKAGNIIRKIVDIPEVVNELICKLI